MMPTPSASLIRPLFRDTALQVSLLAEKPDIPDPGRWRARCIELAQTMRLQLQDAGLSSAVIEEISHAQCALLDESALRSLPEEMRSEWEAEPLQVRFFNSYNAGETVYEQINALLRQSVPDTTLIETYVIVLGLGFCGRYPSETDPARMNTFNALKSLDQSNQPTPSLLVKAGQGAWLSNWRGLSPLMWLLLISALTVILGLMLMHLLDAQVAALTTSVKG
ncbi:DotU/TssL family secretion system protein [Silvimonas soli]|uniref:DotU/TssL family secretion system protein n=1 Tax=Silvimonas soli TaxID=2980100 RepID=UPI0027E4561C|nr:DotU/TssL family secretion system protein [Silvimonas soli]